MIFVRKQVTVRGVDKGIGTADVLMSFSGCVRRIPTKLSRFQVCYVQMRFLLT